MISSALSIAAHAALTVGSATGAHFLFDGERSPRDLAVLTEMVRYLVPPERDAAPFSDRLRFSTAVGGSTAAGIMEGRTHNVSDNGLVGTGAPGQNTATEASEAPVATPARSTEAFTVIEVDSAAIRDPDSAAPDYPRALIEKGIEGYAAMRFVVDSTGRIDLNTVQVIDATHNEFAKAVRDVMPRMFFRPARIGSHAVRQLAEQVFKFEIRIATTTAPSTGKKPAGSP